MNSDPKYLLDANVFIEAARRYYAFDLVPGFWESLIQSASRDSIGSVDRVKQELEQGNDDLAEWVKNDFNDAFISTNTEDVIQTFAEIMEWVEAQKQFSGAAKPVFAKGADGWLVAYAIVHDCIVVTQEVWKPDVRHRIPIPNVCRAFKVNYVDTFEMLRVLGLKFT